MATDTSTIADLLLETANLQKDVAEAVSKLEEIRLNVEDLVGKVLEIWIEERKNGGQA